MTLMLNIVFFIFTTIVSVRLRLLSCWAVFQLNVKFWLNAFLETHHYFQIRSGQSDMF